MQLLFFCPIWGLVPDYTEVIDADIKKVFAKIKNAGYDGVELTVPTDRNQLKEISKLLKKYQLSVIAHEWANDGNDVTEMLKSYEKHILNATAIEPLFINSHTGKDYFSFEDNCRLIERSFQLQQDTGIKINHEIHRGRFSFHCHTTAKYLQAYPQLSLTADFSHWCNVSESYLERQSTNLQLAIKHSRHIHARVGHPQSCQVTDPAAPEWNLALEHHLHWWDNIVMSNRKQNEQILTITPEFGPPPYMVTLPCSQEPIADQWTINLWMKDLLKERYI